MPTFDTPEPITVTLALQVAEIRLRATDRADTVVTVRPRDPDDPEDVRAADHTRVDHVPATGGGRVDVRTPRSWRHYSPRHTEGTTVVEIELPTGSTVRGEASVADVHAAGELGDVAFETAVGDLLFDRIGAAALSSGTGRLTVNRIGGPAQLDVTGTVRIGEVHATTRLKNVNGTSTVEVVAGPLHCRAANGDLTVGTCLADVSATTANGDVVVDDVVRGRIELQTSYGAVQIGIRPGTAAQLDVRSGFGQVRNTLEAADGPGGAGELATVRARTSMGHILIRRPERPTPAQDATR